MEEAAAAKEQRENMERIAKHGAAANILGMKWDAAILLRERPEDERLAMNEWEKND